MPSLACTNFFSGRKLWTFQSTHLCCANHSKLSLLAQQPLPYFLPIEEGCDFARGYIAWEDILMWSLKGIWPLAVCNSWDD